MPSRTFLIKRNESMELYLVWCVDERGGMVKRGILFHERVHGVYKIPHKFNYSINTQRFGFGVIFYSSSSLVAKRIIIHLTNIIVMKLKNVLT
jgi:hypothetical protein